jgi:hypothetical protein
VVKLTHYRSEILPEANLHPGLGPACELLERFGVHGVVPVGVALVSGQGYRSQLLVGDLDSGRVVALVKLGLDVEVLCGGGVGDQGDHDPIRGAPSASPVHGDEAEQAALDLVPLRGPRREVGNCELETGLPGQFGQLDLPGADPVTV